MRINDALILAVKGDTSGWKKATKDIQKSAKQLGKEVKSGFLKVFAGVGAAAAALVPAIRTAGNFEEQIIRLGAVSGASKDELASLEDQAKTLGRVTQRSASDIAGSQKSLALAGFKTAEILNIIPAAIDASVISNEELATVTSKIANGVKAFGIETENTADLIDRMTVASNTSNQSFLDAGSAFATSASGLDVFGAELGDAFALIGGLANVGRVGQEAGTAIVGFTNSLTKNSDKLRENGIEIVDSEGNFKSLVDIIELFENRLKGLTESQQAAILNGVLPETRSRKTLLELLTQGSAQLREFAKASDEANGKAKETVDVMSKGLNPALEELASAWEGLQIAIGEKLNPTIEILADKLAATLNVLTGWVAKTDEGKQAFAFLSNILLTVVAALTALNGKTAIWISKLNFVSKNLGKLSKILAAGGVLLQGLGKMGGIVGIVALAIQGLGFLIKGLGIDLRSLVSEIGFVNKGFNLLADFIEKPIRTIYKAITAITKLISKVIGLRNALNNARSLTNEVYSQIGIQSSPTTSSNIGNRSDGNLTDALAPPPTNSNSSNPSWLRSNGNITELPGWAGSPGYSRNSATPQNIILEIDGKQIGNITIDAMNAGRSSVEVRRR